MNVLGKKDSTLNNWHWTVGGRKHYNKFPAVQHSVDHSLPIYYHAPSEYSNYDWSTDPSENWESLLRRHARNIRDTFKYIRLWFSGGVDSRVMLDAFVSNGIFVDEIILSRCGIKESDFEIDQFALPYLKKLGKVIDRNTKITIVEPSLKDYESFYKQGYWWEQDKINFNFLRITVENHYKKLDYHNNSCELHGKDKPRLIHKNNKWYMFFLDGSATPVYDFGGLEIPFFLTNTDIHAKQCHSLKNAIIEKLDRSYWNKFYKHSLDLEKFVIENTYRNPYGLVYPSKVQRFEDNTGFHVSLKEKKALEVMKASSLTIVKNFENKISDYLQDKSQWLNDPNNFRKGWLSVCSKFYCLTDGSIETVDSLYPDGFDPEKIQ